MSRFVIYEAEGSGDGHSDDDDGGAGNENGSEDETMGGFLVNNNDDDDDADMDSDSDTATDPAQLTPPRSGHAPPDFNDRDMPVVDAGDDDAFDGIDDDEALAALVAASANFSVAPLAGHPGTVAAGAGADAGTGAL